MWLWAFLSKIKCNKHYGVRSNLDIKMQCSLNPGNSLFAGLFGAVESTSSKNT